MGERDFRLCEEMKRMWKMIGVRTWAGKVAKDPMRKTSTPKDMKSETGVDQRRRRL